jgi:glycosyltransferase involved in cell wall biosynthesis
MTSEAPLRILVGTIRPGMPGGIFVTESAFEKACAESGAVEVRRIAFGRRHPRESPFMRTLMRPLDWLVYAWRVIRERPDVVHLNSAFDRRALVRDIGYAVLSAWLRQPLFLKFHGSDHTLLETRSRFWRLLTRATLARATAIGVLSSEEKRNFVAAGHPEGRFFVVKNVVDWRRLESGTWPREDPARLLFIARMVPGKGLADVIRAVRLLADRGRRVTLTAVGDGPARAEAEALVVSLGLADRVRFTGAVPEAETPRYYLESGMLVFPTEREGFSMTIFQSLAAGLPILTTRCRAAADYLREPDHCLWVRPHDPEGLAERIGWLLDHPEAAARMSNAGRRLAREFDAAPVALEYIEVYRRIARRRRPARRANHGRAARDAR